MAFNKKPTTYDTVTNNQNSLKVSEPPFASETMPLKQAMKFMTEAVVHWSAEEERFDFPLGMYP